MIFFNNSKISKKLFRKTFIQHFYVDEIGYILYNVEILYTV